MKTFIKCFLKHVMLILRSLRSLFFICRKVEKNTIIRMEANKRLFILGNGPSLKEQLEKHIHFFKKEDIMCVNGMARTEWYETLKPRYYMLLDPLFLKNEDDLKEYPDSIKKQIVETLHGLHEKTSWSLVLFVSSGLHENKNVKFLKTNPKITLVYMNNFVFRGYDIIRDWLYVKGWAMPHCQNVLVAALYQSLLMGYSEICLFGAEHNWTRYLFVGSDNLVHDSSKHFYAENKKSDIFFDQKGVPIRIAEVLWDFAMMFKGYEEISELNRFFGAHIYNCTPESFIDSFERKDFPDAFRG